MTFCSSDFINVYCHRHWTDELQQAAGRWWTHDPNNAPVAFSDFSKNCDQYKPRGN